MANRVIRYCLSVLGDFASSVTCLRRETRLSSVRPNSSHQNLMFVVRDCDVLLADFRFSNFTAAAAAWASWFMGPSTPPGGWRGYRGIQNRRRWLNCTAYAVGMRSSVSLPFLLFISRRRVKSTTVGPGFGATASNICGGGYCALSTQVIWVLGS